MVHEVQHVRGQVGNHAPARRPGEFPSRRGVGIGAAGVQVGGTKLKHATEAAFVDQLLRPQRSRKEAVLECHLRRAAIASQSGSDLPGFVPAWPPRAYRSRYAFDGRSPTSKASQCRSLGVQMWTISTSGFSVTARKSVAATSAPSQPPGFFGRFCPAGDDVRNPGRKRRRIIIERQGRIAIGMHLADHAETEDANRKSLHALMPPAAANSLACRPCRRK